MRPRSTSSTRSVSALAFRIRVFAAEVPRLGRRDGVGAGMVGMTGRQTGIYAEPRPGGWNLIGQTPLELVHCDGYFAACGDRVRFVRVDEGEYRAAAENALFAPLPAGRRGFPKIIRSPLHSRNPA